MWTAGPLSGPHILEALQLECSHVVAQGVRLPSVNQSLFVPRPGSHKNAGLRLQGKVQIPQATDTHKTDPFQSGHSIVSGDSGRNTTASLHSNGVRGFTILHASAKDFLGGVGGLRLVRHGKSQFRRGGVRKGVTCGAKKGANGGRGKSETDGKQSAAPRVSTNINIPLRYQLRYVKALKDYQKNSTGPPVRQTTGYRRKKERPSESSGVGSGDVVAPSTSLMGQGVMEDLNLEPPVLLVDGYNMCGYWPKLKKHFAKGDLEAARARLIVELQQYGACKGIKVVVVFDAQKSGLHSHSEGDKYLEVVFSADDTADSWIEREAKNLHDKGNHNVWVVTSDLAQQSMAYGFGATVWSCGLLIQEINQARKEMLKQLEEDRLIGELAARKPTFEESVSRDSFDQLATLYEQLSRGAPPDDPFGRVADVSADGSDVSEGRDSGEDDVSGEYSSDDEYGDWLYDWERSDGEESGPEESDNESGNLLSWSGEELNVSRSENGRLASSGNGHSSENGRLPNNGRGAAVLPSLEKTDDVERLGSGGLAETSGRSEKLDLEGDPSDSVRNERPDLSGTEAIPVAFGKGRINLGAAVKRRRRSGGGGYSSGSDIEGPPRKGSGLRSPERDLEIFQRYDTLPDFGYSTGEEDHRGQLHRKWRDVEREVENGMNGKNGSNGKARGAALQKGPSDGMGAGNGRVVSPFVNGTKRSRNGSDSGHMQEGRTENGRPAVRDGTATGKKASSEESIERQQNEARVENGVRKTSDEERPTEFIGGADWVHGGESELGNGSLTAGDSVLIRSTTKRVPGQSPRVAKPRVHPGVSANLDGRTEGLSGVNGEGTGWAEHGVSRSRESDGWDLVAGPESMRSPLLESNGAKFKNGKPGGVKQDGKGKQGRSTPSPPLSRRSEYGVAPADDLYRDLESTPFDELTTEQMLALKYGHTSKPGSEQVKRTRRQDRKRR